MFTKRIAESGLSITLVILCISVAAAQNYPNKVIRIFTSPAGGGGDTTSRIIAQGLTSVLGQPLIVENRGSLFVSAEIVSKAPPDGYTLLVGGGALWIMPLLRGTAGDQLVKDFAPIAMIETSASVVVIHPSLPVRTVKELIALAKARPGELNYGATTAGSSSHLAVELFKYMAGVSIMHVPYKGQGSALIDLIAGRVQLIFGSMAVVTPHLNSGRLRGVAVTSAKPSAFVPSLPALAATVPGYEAVGITGLFAPAKTPEAFIARLNHEIGRFLQTAEAKEKFWNIGVEAAGGSPAEFAAAIRVDSALMGKVIKEAGIKAE